ncbi:MAG: hypothetical protein IPI83_14495 [Sphingomonadales bacterium]|nr:hypothetical protein [Sphingomonadales bacterium]
MPTDLFSGAEEVLRLGHKREWAQKERIVLMKARGAGKPTRLVGDPRTAEEAAAESDWIAENDDILESNARHIADAGNVHCPLRPMSIPPEARRW